MSSLYVVKRETMSCFRLQSLRHTIAIPNGSSIHLPHYQDLERITWFKQWNKIYKLKAISRKTWTLTLSLSFWQAYPELCFWWLSIFSSYVLHSCLAIRPQRINRRQTYFHHCHRWNTMFVLRRRNHLNWKYLTKKGTKTFLNVNAIWIKKQIFYEQICFSLGEK